MLFWSKIEAWHSEALNLLSWARTWVFEQFHWWNLLKSSSESPCVIECVFRSSQVLESTNWTSFLLPLFAEMGSESTLGGLRLVLWDVWGLELGFIVRFLSTKLSKWAWNSKERKWRRKWSCLSCYGPCGLFE